MKEMAFAQAALEQIERKLDQSKSQPGFEAPAQAITLLEQAAACLEQDEQGQPSAVTLGLLEAAARHFGCESLEEGSGVLREIAPPGKAVATSPAPGLATNRELANRIRLVRDRLSSNAR